MRSLVSILDRVQKSRYHWPVNQERWKALVFLATYSGIPTGCRYDWNGLDLVSQEEPILTRQMMAQGLICEELQGSELILKPGRAYPSSKELDRDISAKIDKAANLLLRLDSEEMKLAMQVIWQSQQPALSGPDTQDVELLTFVRQRFYPKDDASAIFECRLGSAIRYLQEFGWVNVISTNALPEIDYTP